MNFCNIFEEVRSNPEWWNNYGLNFQKIHSSSDTMDCADFIKKYIKVSGKSDTSLYNAVNGLEGTVRPNHIVNCFFLGIYLYQRNSVIKDLINQKIAEINDQKDINISFVYIWFIICLFHDLGYAKENDSEKMSDSDLEDEIKKLNNISLGEIDGVPELYENTLNNYLNYRKERYDCIDHGIYAGQILYRDLCIITSEKTGSAQSVKIENEEKTGYLIYSKELKYVYNYVAWIISAHNIFFAKTDFDKKLYKKYKLNSLIIEQNNYQISLNDYPMFFLFCLVDTIEPIKVFKDRELLNSLSLIVKDDELTICSAIHCGCKDTYFSKVKSLNDWLTPVKELDSQTLEIQLESK